MTQFLEYFRYFWENFIQILREFHAIVRRNLSFYLFLREFRSIFKEITFSSQENFTQFLKDFHLTLKPRIHERAEWFANCSRMVRKPIACMCGWYCTPVPRHQRTVRIPFATNRNLSVFCTNTKRTGCAGFPFHAPGVLCSPQVHRKLINHALHANSTARKRHPCVYKALR